MSRPRVTIDAAVLAPAIWIQARLKTHVWAAVASDNRFRSVAKILRLAPRLFVSGRINIDTINVGQIDMQLFEPISRTPGGASPMEGRIALWFLSNDRPEFLFRRHVTSSHERIALSSKSFSSCYTCAPITDHRPLVTSFSGGVAERLIAPVLKTGRPKGLVSSNLTPSATINFGLPISDLRSAAEENARRSERRRSPRPRHRQHLRDNARRDTFAISRSGSE